LCVPLKARGEIIGVAYADNRIREGVFGPGELNLLTQFANQAAIAIYNARLYENVQRALADKTALKELLDNVFASIVSGVITTDAADTVTTCNRAARAILDVDDGDLCPGTVLTQVLPLDEDFSEVLQVVRTQGTRPTMEVEPTISTRGPVTLNLRLSPFQDADEATQGVAIVMDDLTELRRQEAQLAAVRRYLPPAMVDNIQDIEALALSGVRREVTVAFIDVIPFEVLVSASDTEGFMAALNRYLTVATDAINAHEGIVDKYAGNHIMSLFNTQLNPTNDHP
jgi:PAS domain-containing protein